MARRSTSPALHLATVIAIALGSLSAACGGRLSTDDPPPPEPPEPGSPAPAEACPERPPKQDSPCTGSLECIYMTSDCGGDYGATCRDGRWDLTLDYFGYTCESPSPPPNAPADPE